MVVTDYPDEPLVENIRHNVVQNLSGQERDVVAVEVSLPNLRVDANLIPD